MPMGSMGSGSGCGKGMSGDYPPRGGPHSSGQGPASYGMRGGYPSQMMVGMAGGAKGMGGKGMGALHPMGMGSDGPGPSGLAGIASAMAGGMSGCLSGMRAGMGPVGMAGMHGPGGMGDGMGPAAVPMAGVRPGLMPMGMGAGMTAGALGGMSHASGNQQQLAAQQFQLERIMRAAQLRLQQDSPSVGVETGGTGEIAGGEDSDRAEIRSTIRRMEQADSGQSQHAPASTDATRGARGGAEIANKSGRGEGSTVYVGNVPPELNDLGTLNSHFKQFGRIVNIQIKSDHRCVHSRP